ncbi:Histidine kinase-, DNA gyrase B-, and HSP90-like ATPase [Marinobacter segnicrescens]|uniref:histidine kinase n=1 Tax=Marinobacter segnicrescens TaxID=430453 RepID=A0A1I0EXY5_9GAMM|nr:HDOD domain-containing protein [Marinobacter segnicrescens]SET50543.1 Histidine kinase-, DNA gyrase B-, and HSP90-like ATPase [Marinobacter segnicrescens]
MTQTSVTEPLPTLPEVHLRALEACREHDSYRRISDIIHQDPALTARVLTLANGAAAHLPQPVTTLEQALLRLGTDRLSNLVLTAALQQLLFEMAEGHWQALHGFWHDALAVALTSRALARLTRYPEPDTAFLTGMLHNAGKLLLLRQEIAEPDRPRETSYPELSARLAEHWQLDVDIQQALNRQLEDATGLLGAGHLGRMTAVAVQLVTREGHGLVMARTLFGLEEELSAEILRRIRLETLDLAHDMGIPGKASYDGAAATRRLTVAAVRDLLAGDLIASAGTSVTTISPEQVRRQVHEINNPLTVVRQYLARLRSHLSDPGGERDIDIIEEELARASDLLAELTSQGTSDDFLLQADHGVAEINQEVLALTDLLTEGLFQELQTHCSVELCDDSTAVDVPAPQVRQVLLNLLRNAAESRPGGGVQVLVRTAAPMWQQNRQWVELIIEDNGPGLPDAVKRQLFEPVTSAKGGAHSGLGLSIVKQLMDDMDAIISCQSSHSGTLFRLLFPAWTPTEDR